MHEYPALPAFSAALVALFLKTAMTSVLQVIARFRTRSFSAPEDAKWVRMSSAPGESDLVRRCSSVWRNDTENLPLFLALALSYVLLGALPESARNLFAAYVVLRYLHTVAYLRGLQPWRALFYLGGMGVCCMIAARIILRVFTAAPV